MHSEAQAYPPVRNSSAMLPPRLWYVVLAAALFLSPFVYSNDDDFKIRSWQVMGVAGVIAALGQLCNAKYRPRDEWKFLFAITIFLTFQQLLVQMPSLWYGTKYAIVMICAFVPSLTIWAVKWRPREIESIWPIMIKIVCLVIAVNVIGSRILGFGEIYESVAGIRSFGYLGDSINPVIIFPILYFVFSANWIWAALMCATLLLTGGKAALLLLGFALFIYASFWGRAYLKILVIGLIAAASLVVVPFVRDLGGVGAFDYSINNRLFSMEIGVEKFLQHPIVGVGVNQSISDMVQLGEDMAAERGVSRIYEVSQINNAFVRVAAEMGLVGLLIFGALCVLLIVRAYKVIDQVGRLSGSHSRSIAVAGSLWVISFIIGYQGVGWFDHGHPQFAWLLLFSSIAGVAARSAVTNSAVVQRGFLGLTRRSRRRRGAARPGIGSFHDVAR